MKKVCIYCGVEVVKNITTPHDLYGVPAEDHDAFKVYWDGGYYCPKCMSGNAFVTADDNGKPVPDSHELANLKHWFSGAMGKQRPFFSALAELLATVDKEANMVTDHEVARIASVLVDFVSATDKLEVQDISRLNDNTLNMPGNQRLPADVWGLRLGLSILELKVLLAEGRHHGFIPEQKSV